MGDRTLNMQKSFRITNEQNNLTADIKFHFDVTTMKNNRIYLNALIFHDQQGQNNVQKAASSIGSFFGVGAKKQASKRK